VNRARRRGAVGKRLFAAAERHRDGEDSHGVDKVVGQERMDEFGATLGDKIAAAFVPQALYVGDVAQEHRALPAGIDPTRARNRVILDLLEELSDAAMGSAFVAARPILRENFVGLAAEQEIEFLTEEAVNFLAELLIELGHFPAAELEPLGRILGRSVGRLHDAATETMAPTMIFRRRHSP
jgi:hypothetical protein